jgi:hypothetical protein
MIAKAGVPPSKIIVAVAGYARSCYMFKPDCSEPTRPFTRDGATPGDCTQMAGMLRNAEMQQIINDEAEDDGDSATWYRYDEDNESNLMTYGDAQWASCMNDTVRAGRISLYLDTGLLGAADWALDLQSPPKASDHLQLQPCNAIYSSRDDIERD